MTLIPTQHLYKIGEDVLTNAGAIGYVFNINNATGKLTVKTHNGLESDEYSADELVPLERPRQNCDACGCSFSMSEWLERHWPSYGGEVHEGCCQDVTCKLTTTGAAS